MIMLTKLVVKDNHLMMNLVIMRVIMKKNLVQILIMEVKM